MPNVTAIPVSERDEDDIQQRTYFIGLADTASTAYTYPTTQDSLTVKNRSDTASITVTINRVGYTIAKGDSLTIVASFTSFDIIATASSQAFDAIAIKTTMGEIAISKQLNPFKSRLGTRFKISGSDWGSQSIGGQWTAFGTPAPATLTFNANAARLSGAAPNISNMWYYNLFKTASKRAKIKIQFKLISGVSAYGALFGLCPVGNTWWSSPIQFSINANSGTDANKISIYTGYASAAAVTSNAQLPSAVLNDIFEMTIKLEHTAVRVTVKNVTQNATISCLHRWDSLTKDPVNMWNLGVTNGDGTSTWDILDINVTDDELTGLDLLFVGDSISSGVTGGAVAKTGRDFAAVVANRFPAYNISRFSGCGDGLFHYAQSPALNELVARKPKNAFMLLGINDFGNARTLPQIQTDYQTIVSALKTNGTNVIHGGLIPNNTNDVRPFLAWLKSTYSSDVIFDLFSVLAANGVSPIQSASVPYGINGSYSGDGTHPNDTGAMAIADNITMSLIESGIFNPNLMLNNVLSDQKGYNLGVTTASVTVSVTFPNAMPDANYAVQAIPNWNTTCWITGKAATGFTINFGTAAPASATVDWVAGTR